MAVIFCRQPQIIPGSATKKIIIKNLIKLLKFFTGYPIYISGKVIIPDSP